MTNVILAGQYPAHTFETLQELLRDLPVTLKAVDTPEAYETMTDAEIMILRIFKAPEAVIARNPNLKMIMRWGAGFDSVDIEAAGKRGILVTNTPGANADAVSELAVLLMLAVGRKLLCHTTCLRKGVWSKNNFINSSFTLVNKTVGILGAGNIGRKVAQRVQAFGAMTVYYDLIRLSEERERTFNLKYMPFVCNLSFPVMLCKNKKKNCVQILWQPCCEITCLNQAERAGHACVKQLIELRLLP